MCLNEFIHELETYQGNFRQRENNIFISAEKMIDLPEIIQNGTKLISILITPYLINKELPLIYELHDYEFEVELRDVAQSYYVDYHPNNILRKEITDNLKPKAIVAKHDSGFYLDAVRKYLLFMQRANFEEDRKCNTSLKHAELFYQVF